uniref:Uncharacterized protein n=1 Tax=Strongyloides venezuelensis TaxID=75913 RepID=A0A0K0F8B4_STRVS
MKEVADIKDKNDFKDALSEFKKCYLQPHVLNYLIFAHQEMNKSKLIPSYNDTNGKLDSDSGVPERSVLETNDAPNKKRQSDISEGGDAVFEADNFEIKKHYLLQESTPGRLPTIENNSPKDSFNQAKKQEIINNEMSVNSPSVPRFESEKNTGEVERFNLVKFSKETPPFENVAKNLFLK